MSRQVGADTDGTTYCKMYADLSDEAKPVVKRAGLASEDVCQQIVDAGDSLGTDGVDSNDKFEVEFTVHQDEFDAGEANYICAADNGVAVEPIGQCRKGVRRHAVADDFPGLREFRRRSNPQAAGL